MDDKKETPVGAGADTMQRSALKSVVALRDILAPSMLSVNSIPEELREMAIWHAWRATPRGNGRVGKPPVDREGKLASKDSPAMMLAEALEVMRCFGLGGVGLVLPPGYVALDLDDVLGEDGELNPDASDILSLFTNVSYAEWSPSGHGLHIITRGRWAGQKEYRLGAQKVEVFVGADDKRHYITVTGNMVGSHHAALGDGQAALDNLLRWLDTDTAETPQSPQTPPEPSQRAVAGNGHSFSATMPVNARELPLTVEDVVSALAAMSPSRACADRNAWLTVGTAIKAAVGDDGLDLWDEWSRGCPEKYVSGEPAKVWKKLDVTRASAGTLIELARQDSPGWVSPSLRRALEKSRREPTGREPKEPPEWLGAGPEEKPPAPPENVLAKYGAYTARELAEREFPPVSWLVKDMIPVGLTFFAGRPKVGKSWFALQLAHAVATGGQVLGKAATEGRVLYLAMEDSPRRMKKRQALQGVPSSDAITYLHRFPVLAPMGIVELESAIKEGDFSLVILDTLARLLPPEAKQNESEGMTQILGPLQRMAHELDVSIVLVDHHRKRGALNRDVVEDVMGSVSKVGVADTIMGLYKVEGSFELLVTGRDVEENLLKVRFDKGITWAWQPTEAVPGVKVGSRRHEVYKTIRELIEQGDHATVTRIAQLTGISKDNVSREVKTLVNSGEVYVTKGTKKNEKYLNIPNQYMQH